MNHYFVWIVVGSDAEDDQIEGDIATLGEAEAQDTVECQKSDAKPATENKDKEELMPLIKSGISIAADMRFGWRPQQKEVHGAPIPLHYDFETYRVPLNPYTNKPYQIMYLGPRI